MIWLKVIFYIGEFMFGNKAYGQLATIWTTLYSVNIFIVPTQISKKKKTLYQIIFSAQSCLYSTFFPL